jgi:hypothetical protein
MKSGLEDVTNNMVGRVLRRHEIVRKDGERYSLNGFERLTDDEVTELVELCQRRLDDYLARRGDRIWRHRRLAGGLHLGFADLRDSAAPYRTCRLTMSLVVGLVLEPGVLYLVLTVSYTETKGLVPCIEGRSSVARLGDDAHRTAVFGDEGFIG